MRRGFRTVLAVAVAGALVLGACGDSGGSSSATGATAAGDSGANNPRVNLSLVAFSVPQTANTALEAAFAKTPEGKNTTWTESYGASGDQSRAVASGLKADYVHFSLES